VNIVFVSENDLTLAKRLLSVLAMRVSSKKIALLSIFAALHAVLYLLSFELWRSWSIYLEPIEGVVLGPWVGFASAFVGSMAARAVRSSELWLFGVIAEPLGVMACGFIAKKQWKPLLAIYVFMLGAYFAHPYGRWFPLWTILDVLGALVLIFPVTIMGKRLFEENNRYLPLIFPLVAFIGTVTDSLTRIFLLVPIGLYAVFGWPAVTVYSMFILGAADSYIEDILVIIVSLIIGAPLIAALKKVLALKQPLS
jgi:predicted membrane protein